MSKTKLELANEELEQKIQKTNEKINKLGTYTNELYYALINIQGIFDKIRNIPSEMILQYQNYFILETTSRQD